VKISLSGLFLYMITVKPGLPENPRNLKEYVSIICFDVSFKAGYNESETKD
jgi:hypothetical protein